MTQCPVRAAALTLTLSLLTGCASAPQTAAPLPGEQSGPKKAVAPERIADARPTEIGRAQGERVRADVVAPGLQAVRTASILRSRPRPDAEAVEQVPQGAAVTVIQTMKTELGHWVYIKTQKREGWIPASAFASQRSGG